MSPAWQQLPYIKPLRIWRDAVETYLVIKDFSLGVHWQLFNTRYVYETVDSPFLVSICW